MAEAKMLRRALGLARTIRTGAAPVRFIDNRDFVHVTTTWRLTGWRNHAAPDAIRAMLDRTGHLMRRHGEPMVWAYSQESGPEKGVHWHWVVYIPLRLNDRFEKLYAGWLKVKLPPKGRRSAPKADKPVDFKRVWYMDGLIQYLVKDGDDDVRAELRVPPTMARSGGERATHGLRISISPSLREAIAADDLVRSRPARAPAINPLRIEGYARAA